MRATLLIAMFVSMPLLSFAQTAAPTAPPALPQNNSGPAPAGQASPPPPGTGQKSGNWIRDLDLGKLVGAATAPVNLIIAATIAISFLIAKQGAIVQKFQAIQEMYRNQPDDHVKSDKLYQQLGIFAMRLRLINWSARALAITVVVFIGTVTLTSFGVTFPDLAWVKIGTGLTLLVGLMSMLVGFILELVDNGMEAKSIDLEMREVGATRNDRH